VGQRAQTIAPRLSAYRAQFIGIVERGHRQILANYVCARWIETVEAQHRGLQFHLDRRWVGEIQDGGECFLRFWYDPETKSIHRLSINGDG
jgi:hypothetical protein